MLSLIVILLSAMIEIHATVPQESHSIYQEAGFEIVIPENPLAPESLEVRPLDVEKIRYTDWNCADIKTANHMLQKIAKSWDQKGVDNFVIYTKLPTEKIFSWQIAPYKSDKSAILQRVNVLWNVVWGGSSLSDEEIQEQKDICIHAFEASETHTIQERVEEYTQDAFCNESVITKQLVYEGKLIRVLYNYAPIAELQLLIVPKQHRNSFTDLTQDEYLEEQLIVQRLVKHLESLGYQEIHLEEKKGTIAGQTQPHQHLNLMASKSRSSTFKSKWLVLKNILIGKSPLSNEELEQKVSIWKQELSNLFAEPPQC